jgi:hypothetical protein
MSIIQQNIFSSLFETDLSNTIFDYSIQGGFDSNGQIKLVYGNDALTTAIIIWLKSYKGDFVRRPTRGGYVTPHLIKPMSSETAFEIDSAIRTGLVNDFTPSVSVKTLEVLPDYENKTWIIKLSVFSEDLKLVLDIEEVLETLQ